MRKGLRERNNVGLNNFIAGVCTKTFLTYYVTKFYYTNCLPVESDILISAKTRPAIWHDLELIPSSSLLRHPNRQSVVVLRFLLGLPVDHFLIDFFFSPVHCMHLLSPLSVLLFQRQKDHWRHYPNNTVWPIKQRIVYRNICDFEVQLSFVKSDFNFIDLHQKKILGNPVQPNNCYILTSLCAHIYHNLMATLLNTVLEASLFFQPCMLNIIWKIQKYQSVAI